MRARCDADLLADKGRHAGWRLGHVVEKGAEVAYGSELHRQSQAHVIATARTNEGLVGVVEVKVAGELIGRRLAVEPAVAALLRLVQEADGHGTDSQML